MAETTQDPVIIELLAIRLFQRDPLTAQAGESMAEADAAWRGLSPELREQWRQLASGLEAQLADDGIKMRAAPKASSTLSRVITVPAHAAYVVPGVSAQ